MSRVWDPVFFLVMSGHHFIDDGGPGHRKGAKRGLHARGCIYPQHGLVIPPPQQG